MNRLPAALLQSLAQAPGFDKETFEAVHENADQITSVRFNPDKMAGIDGFQMGKPLSLPAMEHKISWSSYGYYLQQRPSFTFDPFFHGGVYYVQEASSMFLEQALIQSVDLSQPLKCLDLCAAPGGKSTLIQSLISKESLLICNEVIKQRAAVLEENIVKWGSNNVVVTNNDPAHFGALESYFDVMVIDAPCSGSGLFRRDAEAINEWSENNVQLCSQRQQRIIADAWPALKEDGVLIYSTCSYSVEEDEYILDWLCRTFDASTIQLQLHDEWQIVETVSPVARAYGYRFYPDKIKGEGFFISVLRKKSGDSFEATKPAKNNTGLISKNDTAIVKPWLCKAAQELLFYMQQDTVIALPLQMYIDLPLLKKYLYIKYAGTSVGRLAAKDLVPDHALALSGLAAEDIPRLAVNFDTAIKYLRKDEMTNEVPNEKGWRLISYNAVNLGWAKLLPNRINNYYPKEWRILKSLP